ncbi:MAG: hypothetical protein PVI70_15950, partial [Gammaproteobacteria bacterium]
PPGDAYIAQKIPVFTIKIKYLQFFTKLWLQIVLRCTIANEMVANQSNFKSFQRKYLAFLQPPPAAFPTQVFEGLRGSGKETVISEFA